MGKNLIHSNELHLIDKKEIHNAAKKMVESLNLVSIFIKSLKLISLIWIRDMQSISLSVLVKIVLIMVHKNRQLNAKKQKLLMSR